MAFSAYSFQKPTASSIERFQSSQYLSGALNVNIAKNLPF
jgi:hypothetical protein